MSCPVYPFAQAALTGGHTPGLLARAKDRHPLLQDAELASIPLEGVDHVPQGVRVIQPAQLLIGPDLIHPVAVDIHRIEAADAIRPALNGLFQRAVGVIDLRQILAAPAADVDQIRLARGRAFHLDLVLILVGDGVRVVLIILVIVKQQPGLMVHK